MVGDVRFWQHAAETIELKRVSVVATYDTEVFFFWRWSVHPHTSLSVLILHLFEIRGDWSWVLLCSEVELIFVFIDSIAFVCVFV
jgi:hypothetical protein